MDSFDENQIGKLLRLKRYEQPPPGYFEDFLQEFHRRQRAELLRQPAWRVWMQRAQEFMEQFHLPEFTGARLASAAAVLLAGVVTLQVYQPGTSSDEIHFTRVAAQESHPRSTSALDSSTWSLSVPVQAPGLDVSPFDAMNRRVHTHRHAAPPRYVLDSTPVSYEPAAFRF